MGLIHSAVDWLYIHESKNPEPAIAPQPKLMTPPSNNSPSIRNKSIQTYKCANCENYTNHPIYLSNLAFCNKDCMSSYKERLNCESITSI